MANTPPRHQSVRVGASAAPAGRGGPVRDDEAKSDEPTDVSHLRPLSEGVLRRAGLHDGVAKDGSVRDKRADFPDAVDIPVGDLPSKEPHVVKMALEQEHGGMIERNVNADGSVTLSMIYGEGDVTTAKGENTYKALEALAAKMSGVKS